MRYDVIVIGAGLAGLVAGLRVLEGGRSCALVNAGQSALHFSSGAFDFLGHLPDGTPVSRAPDALEALADQAPDHPYALLGRQRTLELGQRAEAFLRDRGLALDGSLAAGNRLRITPLGTTVPTWLGASEALGLDPATGALPWKRLLVATVEGFLDLGADVLSSHLAATGATTEAAIRSASLRLPVLDRLRTNPSEFRSVNIARVLDHPEALATLAAELAPLARDVDAVVLPACLGFRSNEPVATLSRQIGVPVRVVPTLPPSLIGARFSRILLNRFLADGGVCMNGDRVTGHDWNGPSLARIYTASHEDIPLEADDFVLATGSFFSGGLTSGPHAVRETLFDLDLREAPQDRAAWTSASVFDPQPYMHYGVRTDATLRGQLNGNPVPNLHVAGLVLGGFDPVHLGCGGGVALVTALAVADRILGTKG
ncbi:glycerol-3-phosphate dehydrogenase subunit GlpB [Phaeovibrio sulfidiphilus]|uniref:Anaerobic glycerol-3-phosphate dehydrogenase subunit B n=1 Tax=Phaeovibrio sulfidiphilus TaxID=1220600 RepID=A0A8J7CW90_9PROT|nr:glycerol-3-phosphate dehydrogenase subunit GlpB [Phaeovibrio sulfidiphilus]MBE1237201.1 glycerol-3-phosphate dehydrogenase subunit GlpB [Phaeovibrio sulfidiphilus]